MASGRPETRPEENGRCEQVALEGEETEEVGAGPLEYGGAAAEPAGCGNEDETGENDAVRSCPEIY